MPPSVSIRSVLTIIVFGIVFGIVPGIVFGTALGQSVRHETSWFQTAGRSQQPQPIPPPARVQQVNAFRCRA